MRAAGRAALGSVARTGAGRAAYRRNPGYAPEGEIRGGGGALRADEVSRHAVRLVVIEARDAPGATRDARANAVPAAVRDAIAGSVPGAVRDAIAGTVPGAVRDAIAGTVPGAARETRADAPSNHRGDVVVGPMPRLEPFGALPQLLRAGDLVVVNDAATLPASLGGRTEAGEVFELRLSGPIDGSRLTGVLFGPGDHRTRTEHRAPPPAVAVGDRVKLGEIDAIVAAVTGRRVQLIARSHGDALWQAVYRSGVPVQYAHRSDRIPLWAVQTGYATRPWAAEMPSAGRALTWDVLFGLRRAGIEVAALTHAAGLSSTGDDALDRALPWPERYEIPRRTAAAVARTRATGGRVIAVGTTVVRALEAAAHDGVVEAGSGTATLRIDAAYRPQIVGGLVSGLHVPGESHFELLSAFAAPERLRAGLAVAAQHGLSSHELGDACLILAAP